MSGILEGKVALVTGAARGIGKAIAKAYAEEGCAVLMVDQDLITTLRAADEIRMQGGNVLSMRADMSLLPDVEETVKASLRCFGRLDILVNNAGISSVIPSESLSNEDWDRVLGVNLKGFFFLTQASAKQMMDQGGGCIINISSIYGQVGAPMRAAYCASKGGVDALTRALAVEWARKNIRINAIAPGYVNTEMVANAIKEGKIDFAPLAKRSPMGRIANVEEIANVALFLASEGASFITGHVLVVDGGWSSYGYIQSWLEQCPTQSNTQE